MIAELDHGEKFVRFLKLPTLDELPQPDFLGPDVPLRTTSGHQIMFASVV
jgi:hypothetical protein